MRDEDDTPLKDLARGPPRSIQRGTHPPSSFPPRLVPHGTCRRNEASRAVPPSGSWLPLSSLQYEGREKVRPLESQRYTYKMPLQSPVLIRSRNVLLVRIAHILLKTDASSPALRRMPGLGPEQRSPSLFPCQVLSREPYQSWRILCALFPRPGEKKKRPHLIL